MPGLRILVVDDHEAVRKGVCAMLRSHPELEVCGEAVDGEDAIAKASALRPNLIIMDISMPRTDGLSASRQILKTLPHLAIIVLSMHDTRQSVDSARRAGVKGYVSKAQAGSALLDAVDAVAAGRTFFPSAH